MARLRASRHKPPTDRTAGAARQHGHRQPFNIALSLSSFAAYGSLVLGRNCVCWGRFGATALNLSCYCSLLIKQVSVQLRLPTSADNVTLLACAAERRAALRRPIDISCVQGPVSASSKTAATACSGRQTGQTDGLTDGRTPYRGIDPDA